MTVNVGVMQLPVTEDPDPVRTYLNGTHPSGGLWTALTRASNHDHSGGLNGVVLGATSIPDGSITTAKLDPAVLLPYALVDGSKPFTGAVTMNADTLIRDTLRFGAKPAGVADVTLQRTGAGALRVDTHLGVGVNPEATWSPLYRVVRVGAAGVFWAESGGSGAAYVSSNTVFDNTNFKAIAAGAATHMVLGPAGLTVRTAPSVAAGANQTFTDRASIAPNGTLTLSPDVGATALVAGGPGLATHASVYRSLMVGSSGFLHGYVGTDAAVVYLGGNNYFDGAADRAVIAQPGIRVGLEGGTFIVRTAPAVAAGAAQTMTTRASIAPTGTLTLTPDAGAPTIVASGDLILQSGTGFVKPQANNNHYLGYAGALWASVWSATGTIQTSSADMKEGITPLSPAACYQAAKDVRWYEYAYLPPAYTPPEPPPDIAYDAADDNETKAEKKAARDEAEAASKAAHLKMVVETAPARHQRGFVFPAGAESRDEAGGTLPPVPDLFGLSDRESTTPQADLATLGCALQEVIRRLEALEAPN